jgi:hypothetical protein
MGKNRVYDNPTQLLLEENKKLEAENERLKEDNERLILQIVHWKQLACDRLNHEILPMKAEIEELKASYIECPYCSPDGTVGFPDGKICSKCEGTHRIPMKEKNKWKIHATQ